MGIYNYICLSRFCACAAHEQDNNNYYLYVQWVAMVFLVYREGFAMVLREASALMHISSNNYSTISCLASTIESFKNTFNLYSHFFQTELCKKRG